MTERKKAKKINPILPAMVLLPLMLLCIFFQVRGNRVWMDWWVYGVMGPAEQYLGQIWGILPFSAAEIITALALLGSAGCLIYIPVTAWRRGIHRQLLRPLLALFVLWLWMIAAFQWMWNAAYYASGFAQRVGLQNNSYSVTELAEVTEYFARRAAELSDCVRRDSSGHFQEKLSECLQGGTTVYENLTRVFPCLSLRSTKAKPLLCSRLQSILGFTGVYFPLTGEANVNIDAPRCLLPATIAHEMSHQRMVASEQEANFVGIAACLSSDNEIFQYSGYLMGLLHLSDALYSTDSDAWYAISGQWFTPELYTDWTDNNAYWAALESPAEDAAEEAYDAFLKSNDQEQGIRSYGACVDLLVSYYYPEAITSG